MESRLWRFIPAGAGNTGLFFLGRVKNGSSPLARGTPGAALMVLAQFRFIPAGAGNTLPRMALPAHRSVHPRWRGEHAHDETRP